MTTSRFIYAEPQEFKIIRTTKKHQSGSHDQSSHGNWADGADALGGDYQMSHRPPLSPDEGASLDNLTGANDDIYPADVYSSRGLQIYGTGYSELDRQAHRLIMEYKGKPDKPITIYRAVPKNLQGKDIGAGDWVTPIKDYAVQHGESNLNDYEVVSREVKAKEIFTSGDSWLEWGYSPSGVEKHQSGSHDQLTHGNWAGGETLRASQNANVTFNRNGSFTYTYGDINFQDRTLPADNKENAYEQWSDFAGNFQMRTISAALMGLNRPKAGGSSEISESALDVLQSGTYGSGSTSAERDSFQGTFVNTHTLLTAANREKSSQTTYRGIWVPSDEMGFDNLRQGERFKMPLTAFTPNANTLSQYETESSREKGVTFTLMPRARGYDNKGISGFPEFVTQGEFEVVAVDKEKNITNVTLRQTRSFNPISGNYEK